MEAEALLESAGAFKLDEASSGIPRHRFLFSLTEKGRIAIVRQLEPALHISYGDDDLVNSQLLAHVPKILKIDVQGAPLNSSWHEDADASRAPVAGSLESYFGLSE